MARVEILLFGVNLRTIYGRGGRSKEKCGSGGSRRRCALFKSAAESGAFRGGARKSAVAPFLGAIFRSGKAKQPQGGRGISGAAARPRGQKKRRSRGERLERIFPKMRISSRGLKCAGLSRRKPPPDGGQTGALTVPGALLVTVRLGALGALVLVHLEASFLF